jgi:serine/threonine-protein kinase RsbW
VPLNAVPDDCFVNRKGELERLRRLSDVAVESLATNVLLESERGLGKTELLKQLYRQLFWDKNPVIPFYYCFRPSALKSRHFAADYLSSFLRQYLAYTLKDAAIIHQLGMPIRRILPLASSRDLPWLAELVDDFEQQMDGGDFSGCIRAALAGPLVVAGRSGKRLVVMLDNFHLAARLFDETPGDISDAASLFRESMQAPFCPHILAGSPPARLESLMANDALRPLVWRLQLRPLPENDSLELLRQLGQYLEFEMDPACRSWMKHLGGNPLYLRNLAYALPHLRRKHVTPADLTECYVTEVSRGNTAYYWASVLQEGFPGMEERRRALRFLREVADEPNVAASSTALALRYRTSLEELAAMRQTLYELGIFSQATAAGALEDPVLRDVIRCAYIREIERKSPDEVEHQLRENFDTARDAAEIRYELVLPMAPDAETVGARLLEEIGLQLDLDREVLQKLQMALIEACLNAMEHSGSYDRRVFLSIALKGRRLQITVESAGKSFAPEDIDKRTPDEKMTSERKRGWGLTLMREFMDDMRVETFADKTRVVLVKELAVKKEGIE